MQKAKKGGKIRLGMVGRGEGTFIGAAHRIASRIDDSYESMAKAEAKRRPEGIEAVVIVT
jgi:hypothetical protein